MMTGWILTAIFGLGTLVLFVILRQNDALRQAPAVLAFGGAGLVLTSFFLLPWVDVDIHGGLGTITGLLGISGLPLPPGLVQQLEQQGVMNEINRIVNETILMTGWRLAAEMPTISTSLQISLFMGPAVAVLALIVGSLAIASQPAAKPMGLLLSVASLLAMLLLFLSFLQIRAFGVDPGIFAPALDLLGIRLGQGVWISFVGLSSSAVAGLFIAGR